MTWFQQLDVLFAEMMELRKMIDQQGICGWPAYDKTSQVGALRASIQKKH